MKVLRSEIRICGETEVWGLGQERLSGQRVRRNLLPERAVDLAFPEPACSASCTDIWDA